MSDNSRHLTEADFERLLGELSKGDSPDLEDLRVHAAECARCNEQMASYRTRTEQLLALRGAAWEPAGTGCPPVERLILMAAGAMDQQESVGLMEHVALAMHAELR